MIWFVLGLGHVIEEWVVRYREEIFRGWQGYQMARALYELLPAPIPVSTRSLELLMNRSPCSAQPKMPLFFSRTRPLEAF